MYCPSCGTKVSATQKFCRSCGLGLEKIAQSLAEEAPTRLDEGLQKRQRKIERWLFITFLGGFTPLILVIVWLIIYNLIILEGDVLKGLLFLSMVLGPAVALLLLFYRESLRKALAERQRSRQALSQTEPTTKALPESNFEPISSITEHTTEILVAKNKGSA
jgi:hypothetical protein